MSKRYTGIIRTLPGANDEVAMARFHRSLECLEKGKLDAVYIALSQKPTVEVLHIYLLVGGEITVRLNLVEFLPGDEMGEVMCWDGEGRWANYWAVCTGPVSRPEAPIKRRGFQGFRYTEELW